MAPVWRCLRNRTFSRFGRTPTCDRQTDDRRRTDRETDTQTDTRRQLIPALAGVARVKNLFFGYRRRDSVTLMLYDLGLPSFNTLGLILNAKHRFNNCCNMADNDIVALFHVHG